MPINEIPFIVSSDVLAGAQNKSADGSQFSISLEDPISIPGNATSVTLEVQESAIWWVTPNILTGVNDRFVMDDGTNGFVTVFIAQGLYDLAGLAAACETAVVNAGQIANAFTYISDESTQKVQIQFNLVDADIDFTLSDTFATIMGFNNALVGPGTFVGETFTAQNIAAFNQIEFFLLHTDLVDRGIRLNNTYTQIVSQVYINNATPPGNQNIDKPFNPIAVPAWGLIGAIRNDARFWLTDQNSIPVNTNGEDYSMRFVIKYTSP
jgi:hypothetical protein